MRYLRELKWLTELGITLGDGVIDSEKKMGNLNQSICAVEKIRNASHEETRVNNDDEKKHIQDEISGGSGNKLSKSSQMEENQSIATSLNSSLELLKPTCRENWKRLDEFYFLNESVDGFVHWGGKAGVAGMHLVALNVMATMSFGGLKVMATISLVLLNIMATMSLVGLNAMVVMILIGLKVIAGRRLVGFNVVAALFLCLVLVPLIIRTAEGQDLQYNLSGDCKKNLRATIWVAKKGQPLTLNVSCGKHFNMWNDVVLIGRLIPDCTVTIPYPETVKRALFSSNVPREKRADGDEFMVALQNEEVVLSVYLDQGDSVRYLINSSILGLKRISCDQVDKTPHELFSVMNNGSHCNLILHNISNHLDAIITIVFTRVSDEFCETKEYVIRDACQNHSAISRGKEVTIPVCNWWIFFAISCAIVLTVVLIIVCAVFSYLRYWGRQRSYTVRCEVLEWQGLPSDGSSLQCESA